MQWYLYVIQWYQLSLLLALLKQFTANILMTDSSLELITHRKQQKKGQGFISVGFDNSLLVIEPNVIDTDWTLNRKLQLVIKNCQYDE